jgi:hypothetical protein
MAGAMVLLAVGYASSLSGMGAGTELPNRFHLQKPIEKRIDGTGFFIA